MSMSRGDETDRTRERERETSAVRNFPDVTKRKRKAGTRKLPNKVNDKDPPGPARTHRRQMALPPPPPSPPPLYYSTNSYLKYYHQS